GPAEPDSVEPLGVVHAGHGGRLRPVGVGQFAGRDHWGATDRAAVRSVGRAADQPVTRTAAVRHSAGRGVRGGERLRQGHGRRAAVGVRLHRRGRRSRGRGGRLARVGGSVSERDAAQRTGAGQQQARGLRRHDCRVPVGADRGRTESGAGAVPGASANAMVRALLVGLVALLALLPTNERQMAYDWSDVNWRLIYEDDFSGYNSQEEFEEAYPPLFGSSADYPVWGATVGPDGQAGIVGTGSYGVGKKGLNPSGRFLRITVRVDKKGVPTNLNVKFINVYYFYDANAAYNAIEIAGYYNHPSPLFTNDTTVVIGHPDIDNSKPNDYFPEGAGGTDLELRVAFSTL